MKKKLETKIVSSSKFAASLQTVSRTDFPNLISRYASYRRLLEMTSSQLLFFICIVLFLVSCNNNTEEKQLTPEEQHIHDSISKLEQKRVADSLKRRNPLLILPPDSEYTGTYVDKYPSGIVKFKGFYRFGKRHGQWLSFYPNGLMWSEMHYERDIRHGLNNTFYMNGKPRYTGFYKNDQRDSIWTFYDTLGNLVEKVLMKNDREIKRLPLK